MVVKVRNAGVETLIAAKKRSDLPREKPSYAALMSKAMGLSQKPEDEPEAIRVYGQIVKLYPEEPMGLNNAAWLLLTAKDEKLRDPRRALPLARKAVELSHEEDGASLDTLAVALHDTGDLAGAARYSRMAAEKSPENAEVVQRAKEFEAEAAKAKDRRSRRF